ncbi:MAG TPA: hypothetical protein VIY52_16700 [Streptosporangiaceae bacterium]
MRLARETYLEALAAAVYAGRLALGGGVREVAEAARAAPPSPRPARPPDLLLDGLAVLITRGFAAGAPLLKRAVAAFRSADVSTEEELRWLWLGCHAAGLVWDYESWDVLSGRLVRVSHEAGALTALRIAYGTRALVHLFAGDFTDAASLVAEAESVTAAMGSSAASLCGMEPAIPRGGFPAGVLWSAVPARSILDCPPQLCLIQRRRHAPQQAREIRRSSAQAEHAVMEVDSRRVHAAAAWLFRDLG